MLQMSVNVDVADVAGLVPLSLQVGFEDDVAGVLWFVILSVQVSAGL